LVEYLIPPTSTATTQGEHVFFDIDVKGGEKSLGAFVAINAKGGYYWHVLHCTLNIVQVLLDLMTVDPRAQI
jgi:hypothetical protein